MTQLKKIANVIETESVTEFEGQPLELSCGMEWIADEYGIFIENSYGSKECACNHPLTITKRLVNIDTGVEKLELAYRKGKQWRYAIADKRTLASNNSILELANIGIAVNSENSRLLVRYIHDLEAYNYGKIPEKNSVSRLGWIDGEGFSPYVKELVFDGDANFKNYFESVKQHGNREKWLNNAIETRKDTLYARIILASSFASALVKPLGALPFFVHLWGGTEAGKTVGLMLAASVWASPEIGRFIHTFNSTAVGREKSAAFVNSMPLILDELQIVSDKKQFDKDIYMLSEGAGRTRGNKGGGVDKTPTWSNCILTSGEMPITNSSSGSGAVNRIIEIECKEKLFSAPRDVADTCKRNYGFAGQEFVELLQEEGNEEKAIELFKKYSVELSSSDITDKQVMAAALILTADYLTTEWIFKDDNTLAVKEVKDFLKTRTSVNANERAYEFISEYIVQNKHKFNEHNELGEIWGKLDDEKFVIIRRAFNQICEEGNFNSQAVLSWMKQNNILNYRGKGFTQSARVNGELCNCVVIKRNLFVENDENYPESIPLE